MIELTQPVTTGLAGQDPCGTQRFLESTAPEAAPVAVNDRSTLGLIELLLKDPARVDQLNREPLWQAELFPRFLVIALAGYLVFSFVMLLVLQSAPENAYPHGLHVQMPSARWSDGTALSLPLAYTLSIVLAACVCLPAFYFFSLLAGANLYWLQIVSLIGKGMASNAIMLLGILPIYVSVALGMIVFGRGGEALQYTVMLGLLLPFASGLWGLRAVYVGILKSVERLPSHWQQRRRCFLRRLTLSWATVYAAVLPIMIYRLWEYFADAIRFS